MEHFLDGWLSGSGVTVLNRAKEIANHRPDKKTRPEPDKRPFSRRMVGVRGSFCSSRETGPLRIGADEIQLCKIPRKKNDLRCLPLARVKLNSPEFGEVVTKAAIVDSSLDQGIYLLSNATAELLNKRISIATVNAVTTRSQKKGENAKGDGKARRIESGTGGHQYKAPNNVMNNIVPDSASLRSAIRSPTIDVSTNRNMFNVSTEVSTAINSTPVIAVPPMSTTGVIGKHGQPQGSALPTNPPQMLFPNFVRNAPHQQIPTVAAAAAASNLHYPPPIRRPGPATVTQAAPQPQQKIGIRPQASVLVPGGKLTPAQQAKLRAEAVQQTHMFFAQSKTGKHDESVSNVLSLD
ncbi:hypothetical protein HNY73_012614 [Argiope bruennichi]|uniref:Uncharacterized protein n=1 Tax=Argiope bruennichi TaxID=94029 RepID=A0A8T0EVI3_ARGBR|nr:hypothetical protein HNY73_012614 [Argiope bruennichi]